MATFTKLFLSESANGRGVPVAYAGSTIHTATSTVGEVDEVWLYAINNDSVERSVTVQWGDVYPEDEFTAAIPPEAGLVLLVPGLVINNGLLVSAVADTDAVITIHGYVHRIG